MACSRIKALTDCKGDNENLPYEFDWSEWLEDEGVLLVDSPINATVTFTLTDEDETDTTPLVVGDIDIDVPNGKVFVWLSGGTPDLQYDITCIITTSGAPARIAEKTGRINVVASKG